MIIKTLIKNAEKTIKKTDVVEKVGVVKKVGVDSK